VQRIRTLSWILLIISVLIGAGSYGLQYIHFNDKKPLITGYIKQVFSLTAEVDGNVGVSILPPAVTVGKISLYDAKHALVLTAKEIRLNIEISNILSGIKSMDVKNISISRGGINFKGLINHIRGSGVDFKSLSLDSVVLEKCQFLADKGDQGIVPYKMIKDLNATIRHGALLKKGDLNIVSDLLLNNVKYDFTGHFDDLDSNGSSSKAAIKFSNSAVSFDFAGELKNLFISPELKGSISSQVANVENFKHIIKSNPFLEGFFKNNQLILKSDFSADSKMIKISDITVASRDIQNLKGNIEIDLSYGTEMDINVSIDKIDLDAVKKDLPVPSDEAKQGSGQYLSYLVNTFDFSLDDSLSAMIGINIKEIALNGDKITDIKGSMDIFNGIMLIDSISANFPGSGKASFDGKVTHNTIRPQLNGQMKLQIPDFKNFASWADIKDKRIADMKHLVAALDLDLIPNHLIMDNIKAALGDVKFVGKIIAHDDTNTNLSFDASLRFNQLNLDDLQITDEVDGLLYNLFVSDFDKTGEKFSAFTRDLRWLRTWKHRLNLELTVDEVVLKKQSLDNVYMSMELMSNNLLINRISVDSDNMTFHGNLNMTMPLFRPYIAGKIIFDKLDVTKAALLLPDFSTYRKAYRDSLTATFAATPAKDPVEEQDRKNALELSTYEFNFLGATNYDADLDLEINNIASQTPIAALTFHANLLNGVINIKNISAQAFDGAVEGNASIVAITSVPYFNAAFALINVQPGKIYNFITGYPKNMDGYLSASVQIAARGMNSDGLYNNLSGKAEFAAKRVPWNGFDLGKVIEGVESSWDISDKMKVVKYYTDYGNTIFDSVKGSIAIADGIATTNNVLLQNDRVSAVLAASYSIPSKMCSLVSRYAFIPTGRNNQLLIDMQSKGEISQLKTDVSYDSIQKYLIAMSANNASAAIMDNSVDSILRSRRGG